MPFCFFLRQETLLRDVPFFIWTPAKDGKFLHKGGRILNQRSRQRINSSETFFKGAAKKLTLRLFSSKGAAKTLRGWNPAILRGGADKKWDDPPHCLSPPRCINGKEQTVGGILKKCLGWRGGWAINDRKELKEIKLPKSMLITLRPDWSPHLCMAYLCTHLFICIVPKN